jgi:hypothetical protein
MTASYARTIAPYFSLARAKEGPAMPKRVALVTALIVERPACLDCIIRQSELGPADVKATIEAIARVLALYRGDGTCGLCGAAGPVLSLLLPREA